MREDPLDEVPKPADFVRSHLEYILDYVAKVAPEEFLRLQLRDYSTEQFRLSYPFFKSVEKINADGDTKKFWTKQHSVQGQLVRVCSQWTKRQRPFLLNYLVTHQLPVDGISPEINEEWLAVVEQAGSVAKSPGGARYRGTPIGVAQNALVRYLLSNLGQESFTETDWKAVKASFGAACAYCGKPGEVERDHAIPLSRLQLGEHRLGNLVPACSTCNRKKSHLRFRPFLETNFRHDPREAAARIERVETHMARHGYRAMGERSDIRALLEHAREDIAATAARYLQLINEALDPSLAGMESMSPPTDRATSRLEDAQVNKRGREGDDGGLT